MFIDIRSYSFIYCWNLLIFVQIYSYVVIFVDISHIRGSYLFICDDICWYLFYIYWYLFIFIDCCVFVLIFVDLCKHLFIVIGIYSYLFIVIHMWWYLFIFGDRATQSQRPAGHDPEVHPEVYQKYTPKYTQTCWGRARAHSGHFLDPLELFMFVDICSY